MKKILAIVSLTFFLFAIQSCDDKTCQDVVCGNNQTCSFGNCLCNDGYEGENCDILAYEKYVGNYNISKSCTQGQGQYVSFGVVQANGNPVNELLFFNFLNLGQTAYAYIGTDQSGKGNYLRFPSQNLGSAEIVGEGFYEDYNSIGRIRLEIQLTFNNQLSKCTYTYY